jgi:hypothetical protein
MLMNWAITFLACTSASTYNEVAKIMMLPNISTVYQKTAELITAKNDKAYCMHMNTICSMHIVRIGQATSGLGRLLKIPPTSLSMIM